MIKVAAAQYPITYHPSFDAWAAHTQRWVLDAVGQSAQLLVFPEYGAMELASLFPKEIQTDIHAQVREMASLEADFCNVFADLARQHQVVIVAPSYPVTVSGELLNRAFVFSPKGLVGHQDKFFMTRFEDEEWGIKSAPKLLSVFEADWGRFGIQICYDSEFPIGSQLLCEAGAGMILVPSCTETIRGATRVHVGARARALENQCFTVVSHTIGTAVWSPAVDLNYGYGAVYCPPDKGLPEEGIVATMPHQQTGWLVQSLDFQLLEAVRQNGQVFNFKDNLRIKAGLDGETIRVEKVYL